MPIFTKNDRRVYFAHIPKTAGSAVYLMFLGAGWHVSNLETGTGKKRIGYHIKTRFGITDIPIEGDRHGFDRVLQHAPAEIWQNWGPFDDSFAVTRHPEARFQSALRYLYGLFRRDVTFQSFSRKKIKDLKRKFRDDPASVDAHFQPQHTFVGERTFLSRYEDDWAGALRTRYDLGPAPAERINVSPPAAETLGFLDRAWLRRVYAEDYARFDYPPSPAPINGAIS